MVRALKLVAWAMLALGVVAALVVLIAPAFTSDERALEGLYYARGTLFSWFPVFLVAVPIAFAVGALVAVVQRVRHPHSAWSEHWLLSSITIVSVLVPAIVGVIVAASFLYYLAAPDDGSGRLRLIHVAAVTVDDTIMDRLLGVRPLGENARLVGPYLLNGDIVRRVGEGGAYAASDPIPDRLFDEPVAGVSDIMPRQGQLFVIAQQRFLSVDVAAGTVATIANLPASGMRFGQIKRQAGAASNVLVSGNDGATGLVYELRTGGQYAKLVETEEPIVSAAGCHDQTSVAFQDRVVTFRPGFKPVLAFRAPEGESITSILIRQGAIGARDNCMLLIATKNVVYGLQDGLVTMLIAGIGGNLGAREDDALSFTLADPERDAVIVVDFVKAAAGS